MAKSALYVTHVHTEALTMADRIVVLESGVIMGIGTPRELYDNPPNRFVAQFLGRPPINLTRSVVVTENDVRVLQPHGWRIPAAHLDVRSEQPIEVGIRPEDVRLREHSGGADGWRIVSHEFLGDKIFYALTKGENGITALVDAHSPMHDGAIVDLEPMIERLLLFDPMSGRRISTTR